MSSPSSNTQSGQLSREDIAKVWNAVFIPYVRLGYANTH
jgi:hypothetical protein